MYVLLVDKDPGVIAHLRERFADKSYQVRVSESGAAALELIAREAPLVAVIEMALPDMSGIDLCRRIREQTAALHIPVLFLSEKASAQQRVQGLEAGADDYLSKPFDPRELDMRLQALIRWAMEQHQQAAVNQIVVGGLRLDIRTFKAEVDGRAVQLTPVEFELLHYLMLHAGQVVSAEQLLQEVWRYYPGTGDPAVVRVQVMNLRNKIESDREEPRYIQTVYRRGYMVAT